MNKVYINHYDKKEIGKINTIVVPDFAVNKKRAVTKINNCNRIMDNMYCTLRYTLATERKTIDVFNIPKRTGGYRTIIAPTGTTKSNLTWVLKELEKIRWIPSNNAHAFTKHRNCKTAVETHQKNKSRWFLKLDIHDFFGSTTTEMVIKALKENFPFSQISVDYLTYLAEAISWNGTVPQGFPTSPYICNIVMNKYDYMINEYCKKNELIYTRYADDLLISSPYKWDYTETIKALKEILPEEYKLSDHKTRFGSFNGRNWNLGIMFNNEYKLTVGRQRKRQLKSRVYNYMNKPATRTEEEKQKLLGQLGYCKYIEPEYTWFSNAIKDINNI